MRKVYFGTDNIITSLGFTTTENATKIKAGISGINVFDDGYIFPGSVAYSAVNTDDLEKHFSAVITKSGIRASEIVHPLTRIEKMFMVSIASALENSGVDPKDPGTVMIFSTTKGNVDQLQGQDAISMGKPRVLLWEMADYIARLFNCSIDPVVISNACTSGSVAIIHAARMIAAGQYDHAIVTGGDIISEFVIAGFQSFQALSPEACRPFDAGRTGLSLGEGCGTVILSSDRAKLNTDNPVTYLGGGTSNDANHISGPSRDGEGLYLAIKAAMKEAGAKAGDIDYISAHGTATPYNDEMESLALAWAGMDKIPVNSFKGYIGHTLGAAGVIETILSIYSIRNNILLKSIGYENNGVTKPLNIITENIQKPVSTILKTASGFGGCNAAIVVSR